MSKAVVSMNAVSRWYQTVVSTLSKPPPKLFFPSFVNFKGFFSRFKETERKEGFWRAYNKTRMESTLRKGMLVGTDANGNKYFEDRNAPYGRTRWVEYPTPPGVFAIELKFDGSMVSPEWHGWLHYMHDKPGSQLAAEFDKPFKQAHTINQSMLRPEFSREGLDAPQAPEFHEPPGTRSIRTPRGRIGTKYEAWTGSPTTADPELRNYADNQKTLHIP